MHACATNEVSLVTRPSVKRLLNYILQIQHRGSFPQVGPVPIQTGSWDSIRPLPPKQWKGSFFYMSLPEAGHGEYVPTNIILQA